MFLKVLCKGGNYVSSVVSGGRSGGESLEASRFVDVLAVVGAEGALVGVLRGLVADLGLGDDVDALVTLGRDTDGLLVNVTGVLWAN